MNVSATSTTSSLKPAFLSHFPRSLSSLSLGGRKKPDKDAAALAALDAASDKNRSASFAAQQQPPPLPQRNFPRRSQSSPLNNDNIDGDMSGHDASPIVGSAGAKKKSKADSKLAATNNNYYNEKAGKASAAAKNVASLTGASAASAKVRKRAKKLKDDSDLKLSAQLFIQTERECEGNRKELTAATGYSVANEPPPLPPRQPGMLEENQNLLNNNKCGATTPSGTGGRIESRPSPNSLDTRMNYPLITTATAVSQFPLANRPNILQRLQQQQQNTHPHVSSVRSPLLLSRLIVCPGRRRPTEALMVLVGCASFAAPRNGGTRNFWFRHRFLQNKLHFRKRLLSRPNSRIVQITTQF